jgi:diguanylate cyclase (GGDEF)-like protein
MHIFTARTKWQKALSITIGFALVGVIGVFDFFTPNELSFSTFYLVPLFILAWTTSVWLALTGAGACVLAWSLAELLSGHVYDHPLSLIWNVGVDSLLFAVIAYVLSALRTATEHEKALARSDPLTGAANTRSFLEMLALERDRFARYGRAFTLAYMDLDNFKAMNDVYGHAAGDEVLRVLVQAVRRHLRSSDTVARLGGDEFALILPETDEKAARVAVGAIRDCIVEEMERNDWTVTISIGVYTCRDPSLDQNRLVTLADDLMYRAKNGGKNSIVFSDAPTASP